MEFQKPPLRHLLGQSVHVEVDRPIGYLHGDILYPVNYGYIPDLMGGDGEEQDAYILGISEPLTAFDGRVIGIIHRLNDREDKLVVAPEGDLLHQAQIAEAVHFQEQYFRTTIDSLLRRSCGVIPFRRTENGPEFLIVLQTNHCWSFPKGHMEAFESETETALRELFEETGLRADLLPVPGITFQYPVNSLTTKQVILFPGPVRGELALRESEILDSRWVPLEDLSHYFRPDTARLCTEYLSGLMSEGVI